LRAEVKWHLVVCTGRSAAGIISVISATSQLEDAAHSKRFSTRELFAASEAGATTNVPAELLMVWQRLIGQERRSLFHRSGAGSLVNRDAQWGHDHVPLLVAHSCGLRPMGHFTSDWSDHRGAAAHWHKITGTKAPGAGPGSPTLSTGSASQKRARRRRRGRILRLRLWGPPAPPAACHGTRLRQQPELALARTGRPGAAPVRLAVAGSGSLGGLPVGSSQCLWTSAKGTAPSLSLRPPGPYGRGLAIRAGPWRLRFGVGLGVSGQS
jgi:hypothetical protein